MREPMVVIGVTFLLAFLCESMVEYLFGEFVNHVPKLAPAKWALMYVAAGVGVGFAFWYGVDLIALVLNEPPTTLGILLSGLSIGRGANYVHGLVSTYILKKPQAEAYARRG